ncbi:ornithine cyclodeaminase family protein [Sulfitobacter geojensis]|uniref:NAD(P)-binding domain-containing protein n=1 Tax=Sulfitobacter geojensis TaxID=1342299 RepID=A0AAE3B6Z7_9RHOB|nr:NAD(P)-binding domain-containing protein [Sulfitobacter geojensis]MBM1689689.1 NAD(P)-binding domain-containing protein [Sulfitobacter geojensis]MBM1693755.1 NAD(P)-binding domain-containing protein [Sulfitobacter geojensis]MBM1705921.1 NAD(P)-binding domain-containing protein [Sulfitobacter geojensis]MBM1709979.1 NAD(P)-binding domain-containing protein [Sulfitobacter geojensis]MBM1714045.1 NAD(P)-binding domain-containing protein [Sulfitobacter geojensis]
MSIPIIPFTEGEANLDWIGLTDALASGHTLPKAEIGDTFLYRGKDTLLSRAAWIDGLGIAVKSATIFPDNPAKDMPMVNGGLNLYADGDGTLEAIVDFHLVTKWKTAGDSLLAARRLARPDSRNILIVGAGNQGRALHAAYSAAFPDATFTLWNRSPANAEKMAGELPNITVVQDLETAVTEADIITSATMSTDPLIKGAWLRPGQHLDLIGAYRPDMREVDDEAIQRARVFVDSFDTTIGHIGEINIPLEAGTISRDHLIADYYQLDAFKRQSADDITLFKNGGGAHLDLMTSRYILDRWTAQA